MQSGGLNMPNTFSSYRLARVMKSRYHTISTAPNLRSSFQPLAWVATTRNTTVENRERVE